jgi:hypothetical protein
MGYGTLASYRCVTVLFTVLTECGAETMHRVAEWMAGLASRNLARVVLVSRLPPEVAVGNAHVVRVLVGDLPTRSAADLVASALVSDARVTVCDDCLQWLHEADFFFFFARQAADGRPGGVPEDVVQCVWDTCGGRPRDILSFCAQLAVLPPPVAPDGDNDDSEVCWMYVLRAMTAAHER